MENNFLNMRKDEFDKHIFRVFTVDRLLEVFKDRKLTLVNPKKWDDPFENHIMNAVGELTDGKKFTVGFRR